MRIGNTIRIGRAVGGRGWTRIPEATYDLDFARDQYYGLNKSDIVVSRASDAYAMAEDGSLVLNPPNTLNRSNRGVWSEEARTNLCLQSENFANTWVGNNPVASSVGIAPNGTMTADLITSANVTNQSVYQIVTVAPQTQYTFSCFVKLGTLSASGLKLAFYDQTAGTMIIAEVVPNQTPNALSWTRVQYTLTTPAGCTALRVYPFRSSPAVAGTFYLWGAQLEMGANASTYIPTTSAATVRAKDQISVPVTGIPSNVTVYVETEETPSVDGGATWLRLDNNGSPTNAVELRHSSTGLLLIGIVSNAGSQATAFPGIDVQPLGTPLKFAYRINGQDAAIASTGGKFAKVTATAPLIGAALIRMLMGQNAGNVEQPNVPTRRIAIIPRAYSDAELQALVS